MQGRSKLSAPLVPEHPGELVNVVFVHRVIPHLHNGLVELLPRGTLAHPHPYPSICHPPQYIGLVNEDWHPNHRDPVEDALKDAWKISRSRYLPPK